MHLIYFQINVHCTYTLTSKTKFNTHDMKHRGGTSGLVAHSMSTTPRRDLFFEDLREYSHLECHGELEESVVYGTPFYVVQWLHRLP